MLNTGIGVLVWIYPTIRKALAKVKFVSSYSASKAKRRTSKRNRYRKLCEYLEEVINYVTDVTSTNFDAHFSEIVTFECKECGQSIVRNYNLLKDSDIVQCQNPNCNWSYIAHKENDNFTFEYYNLHFDCPECKKRNYINANDLLNLEVHKLKPVTCKKCETQFYIYWSLQLKKAENNN